MTDLRRGEDVGYKDEASGDDGCEATQSGSATAQLSEVSVDK